MIDDKRPAPPANEHLRAPPHSIDSEQSVLGGLLLNNDAWDAVGDLLTDSDFYRYEHRLIFGAISALVTASKPADTITVYEHLTALGKMQEAGGLAYLNALSASVPNAANCRRYAEVVRERAILRKVIATCDEVATRAFNTGGATAAQILGQAQEQLFAIGESGAQDEPQLLSDLVPRVLQEVEDKAEQGGVEWTGTPTGFTDVDNMLCGMQPGDLVILAAASSMGKTALALNIGEHVALRECKPVVIFEMEMSAAQLTLRTIASEGRINGHALRKGRLAQTDWQNMTAAVTRLTQSTILIDESPGLSHVEIRARARRAARKYGQLGLVIVDYLQLMGGNGGDENRASELGAITRALKALGKELRCPVLALSQLNRSIAARPDKRPLMSDLRECLPVEEWVDTPAGPVQLKTRPTSIITAGPRSAGPADCSFIEKRYNSTYRVTTKFGSFSATARHLVLTGVGWKEVRDLVPGRDVVACPLKTEHENRGPLPHARLLGWLIGNGYLTGTPGLVYRNELEEEVRAEVEKFGVEVRPCRMQKSANVTSAYLSNGVESGCLPNPLMLWIRSMGLEGKTAHEKFIPSRYMGSSDDTHRELLRGLWETDGTVTCGNGKYATCSELLARQVKWLLHTVGIRSTVSFYENEYSGMWEVRCATEDNERLENICANRVRFPSDLQQPSSRYIDPAPAIFVELVAELYRGAERLQRRGDGKFKNISKERMRSILKECRISTISESPYMTMDYMGWAPVAAVDHQEQEVRVCDLHVPQTNCFLTNGLVAHNSGALEQDADVIAFVYRDDYYNKDSEEPGVAEIIIAKNRNGPTGTVKLSFLKPMTKFENLDPNYTPPPRESQGAGRKKL